MNVRKNKIGVVLCIGLILRVVSLLYFWDMPLTIVDENHYQAIAEHILNDQQFALESGQPTSIRPPLYPAFLSGIYVLTGGIHFNAVRIVQIIFSLATIYLIYLLGKQLFSEQVGLLAAFIFSVYPSFIFFTHLLLTEVLFTFLFILFIFLFLEFLKKKENRIILFAGLILGFGALTRSILYPFLMIGMVYIAIFCAGSFSKKITWLALFMFGYVLVVGPWAVRNTILQKSFVAVDTMGGLNMYMGNYEHTPFNRAWTAVDLPAEQYWSRGHEALLAGMTEAQKDAWASKQAKTFILNNKLLTLKRALVKAASFWGLEREIIGGILAGHYPGLEHPVVLISITLMIFGSYVLVAMGAVFGLTYHFQFKRYDILFLVILLGYFTGIHTIIFGHSRYHLPLISFLVIFAAWTFTHRADLWKERARKSFTCSLFLTGLLITIWIREIVFVEGARYLETFF